MLSELFHEYSGENNQLVAGLLYLVHRFILQTPCISFKPKRLRYPFDSEFFKHAIIIRLSPASQEESVALTTLASHIRKGG